MHVSLTAPTWNVVVELVRSLILPRITYGMPVFAPTAAQSAKIATALTRGLYRLMGIDGNPSTMALLVDNCLLSPAHHARLFALRFANRLWHARKARNPASDALLRQLRAPLGNSHVHSTARLVRAAETDFQVKFDVKRPSKPMIRALALRKQRKQAINPRHDDSTDSKERKAMLPEDGPAVFMQLLPRREANVLALFRYNRVKLNHVVAVRDASGAASDDCPFCPGVSETMRHALFACPKYDVLRAKCAQDLDSIRVPMTYTVMLGAVESLHKDRRQRALNIIVTYLSKVREVRHV